MKVLDDVGRGTIGFFDYLGRLRIRMKETIAQASILGVQSTVIVLLTSLFTGMVISLESANSAKAYGVSSLVGGAVTYVSARELGPMLTAVVVAGRAGAAIAAELGSMVVTEQIEALEALGLSPVQMLVVPRLLAMLAMLPLLTILADIVAISGGMVLAKNVAQISYHEYIESARVFADYSDFIKGMIKAFVFAVIIVIVACYQGFGVRGGAAGVGKATTGSVVISIILIFVANFLMSLFFFGPNAQ